jgi:hypothetical protein
LTTELDYIVSFAIMLFIYFIAFMGYRQPAVFNGFGFADMSAPNNPTKYRFSTLTEGAAQELVERLERGMQEHKWYLENDLSLDRLAELVGTSKHSLSQVLNEKLGMSYFDYNFLFPTLCYYVFKPPSPNPFLPK